VIIKTEANDQGVAFAGELADGSSGGDLGTLSRSTYLGMNSGVFAFQIEIDGEQRQYLIPGTSFRWTYVVLPKAQPGGLFVPAGVPQSILDQLNRGGPLGFPDR
jgi:hypothetical protein